jgi:hypothetical protein
MTSFFALGMFAIAIMIFILGYDSAFTDEKRLRVPFFFLQIVVRGVFF